MTPADYPFGTHLPTLLEFVLRTKGPILEIGSGKFSSPVLQLFADHRQIVCVEPSHEWRLPGAHYVPTVADALALVERFDVVLIDGPMPRLPTIEATRGRARYLVMHDSEQSTFYQYPLTTFKFRRDDKRLVPWTTVCSDTDPV